MQTFPKTKNIAIIPAYNECEKISQIVSKIRELAEGVDVVVIDDGSVDNTADCAKSAGATVLRLCNNMGYGVSLQTGIKFAYENGYENLVQLDGDGQHDPVYIPEMLHSVISGEADLILGSRFLIEPSDAGGNPPVGYEAGAIRKMGMVLFAFLATRLVGFKITDPTSGYQSYNRRVMAFLIQDFFPCDFPDADVIVMIHRAGFKIREFPMQMSQREDGKSMHSGIKPVYYVFKMFLSLFMTILRKKPASMS
jgi:glycosyltransferase involved in cell wall biosynthesis